MRWLHAGPEQHDGMTVHIDAAPTGPARQLGVLPGVMSAWVWPFHFTKRSRTTVRAGMLMPRPTSRWRTRL